MQFSNSVEIFELILPRIFEEIFYIFYPNNYSYVKFQNVFKAQNNKKSRLPREKYSCPQKINEFQNFKTVERFKYSVLQLATFHFKAKEKKNFVI